MRYQRFRLQILPGPANGYTVHAQSVRGEGQAPFIPPFRAEQAAGLHHRLSRSGRNLEAGGAEDQPESPESIGERLFVALFPGEILRLYERSRDLLDADSGSGLRLELTFDPRDSGLAALQEFPWELLRRPGTGEFLALSRRRPVVRYFAVPQSLSAPHHPETLRILAVGALPCSEGFDRLELDRELDNLRKAVSGSGIEIVTPESATLGGIRKALLQQECHILHFMGHGGTWLGFEERVLFLEKDDGSPDPVRGGDLLNKLADFPWLRLAVLNACESAVSSAPSPEASFNPFAGVASSLVVAGMPAVIAMQVPISDDAAIAFSRTFYQRLAAGDPVDAAVAEGRQEMHSADPTGFEWSTPVLFLRAPDSDFLPFPGPRQRRFKWAWRAAIGLLAGLVLGSLILGGWLTTNPRSEPRESGQTPPLPHPAASSPSPEQRPTPPSEPSQRPEPVGDGYGLATTPVPKASIERPIEITLRDGEQRTVLSDQAALSVAFNSMGQEDFVTVTINGTPHAILSPGALFPLSAGGKPYSVYVVRINPDKSIVLRVARAAHNS